MDDDALRLAELGYAQSLTRKFSIWSILAVSFSLCNAWLGVYGALVVGINSGGTAVIIYGMIIIGLISTCVAISLSELASAMPSAGGQYYWAYELASPKYQRFAGYFVGWCSWAGSIFCTAAVVLVYAFTVCGMWQLGHPEYKLSTYHTIVAYQAINASAAIFNCYGKTLVWTARITLWVSIISFVVIFITVPSVTPEFQPASFVFATFINNTGWENPGIAFMVGLINPNWLFVCLDCATHLAEEVPKPERNIPIAICSTVAMAFVTAWSFAVAMFFSLYGDVSQLTDTATGVPFLALFYSVLTGRPGQFAGAIILESLIFACGFGCIVACHTWQSRLLWSFARDGGLPFHKYLAKSNKKLDVPLRAHLVSSALVAIVGLLYIGSSTAFNSMITATIVLLYISYAVPIASLLLKGRDNIRHGPFWLGKTGLFSDVVVLCWTLFTLVIFSFPYKMPATASDMNYVSVVYAVVGIIVAADWCLRGRKVYGHSEGEEKRRILEDVLKRRADST